MCGWSNKIIASDFLCKSLFAPWLSHGQNKPSICIYAGLNYFYDLLGPTWGFYSPAFSFYGARGLGLIRWRWRDLSAIRGLWRGSAQGFDVGFNAATKDSGNEPALARPPNERLRQRTCSGPQRSLGRLNVSSLLLPALMETFTGAR